MIEEQAELALDDMQREAVMEAVRHGILIVTGGPGTGKTTTINAMIHFFEEEGAGYSSGSTDRTCGEAHDRGNRL